MNTNTQNRRRWLYGAAALLLLTIVFLAVRNRVQGQSETSNTTQSVTTAVAFTDDLETTISANGNLMPDREMTLAFSINGRVADVLVEVGDAVEAGDELMRLDTAGLERAVNDAEQMVTIRQADVDALKTDALKDAEDRVEDAEDALDDARDLDTEDATRDTAIAEAEAELEAAELALDAIETDQFERSLTVAEAQLQQARNGLESAESNLANATLTAPFDGIVSRVNVQEGDIANGAIVTIFDPDSLVVTLDIDEIDLRELSEGTEATLTIDALPSLQLDGTVQAIAVSPTPTQGDRVTYAVTVALDETDDDLRYGMSAKVRLTTAERYDVLLIPNEAITADTDEGTYFVRVMEGDTMVRVEVEIGMRDRDYTEIESGLDAGDTVVVHLTDVPTNNEAPRPGGGGSPFGN